MKKNEKNNNATLVEAVLLSTDEDAYQDKLEMLEDRFAGDRYKVVVTLSKRMAYAHVIDLHEVRSLLVDKKTRTKFFMRPIARLQLRLITEDRSPLALDVREFVGKYLDYARPGWEAEQTSGEFGGYLCVDVAELPDDASLHDGFLYPVLL